MKYSKKEIDFLIKNYSSSGSKYCSEKLKRSELSIRKKASRLNLRVSPERKNQAQRENSLKRIHYSTTDSKINPEQFIFCKIKYCAYILGLIWADGYVNTNKYSNLIILETEYNDSLEFYEIFKKTGQWNLSSRKRDGRRKQGIININNKKLATFLYENGYKPNEKKLSLSINQIPKNLEKYWLLGIIDGDGCWYPPQKQFSICGPFDQDWDPIISILSSINVKSVVSRRKQKNHSYSILRVCGRKNLKKIGNFIYDNNFIGLSRKYKKYLESININK